MNARNLLNLILFITLIALISFAVLVDDTEDTVSYPVSQLTPDQVTTLEISVDEQPVQMQKTDGLWMIMQPLKIEADEFRVHAILKLLTVKTDQQYDASTLDLNKYSLQPARASLTIDQQTFLFGGVSSVDNRRYLLTNNKLMLVEDTFFPLLSSGYKNLMRRQLMPSNAHISAIELDDYKIYLNPQAAWEVSRKNIADTTLSADAVKLFVDNWQHIQAYAVYSAHKPYTGTTVTVHTADSQQYQFILQNTGENTVIINTQLELAYQFDITAHTALTMPDYYRNEITE